MAAFELAPGRAVDLEIESLQPGDAQGLCPLAIEVGWNQLSTDWQLMLSLGQGFGIRGADGKWIGSALTLPLGPSISWISMVLVTRSERRKGLGARLLSRCIAHVEASGSIAGLDATELGRPVYEPLGFRDVYPLSRWNAAPGVREVVQPPIGISLRAASPPDLPRIGDYDRLRSGFERTTILANLVSRAPTLAQVAERTGGTLAGYALARDGYHALQVGPVVADNEDIGLALLSSVMFGANRSTIVDIPDRHVVLRRWLQEQGATAPRTFMRMLRGENSLIDHPVSIFALAGPELA
jgi:GNAT superfamily N-acetyltransferase